MRVGIDHWYGISGIRLLSPATWEADTLSSDNALHVCQPDTDIKPQFTKKSSIFSKKRFGLTQEGGFSSQT